MYHKCFVVGSLGSCILHPGYVMGRGASTVGGASAALGPKNTRFCVFPLNYDLQLFIMCFIAFCYVEVPRNPSAW